MQLVAATKNDLTVAGYIVSDMVAPSGSFEDEFIALWNHPTYAVKQCAHGVTAEYSNSSLRLCLKATHGPVGVLNIHRNSLRCQRLFQQDQPYERLSRAVRRKCRDW